VYTLLSYYITVVIVHLLLSPINYNLLLNNFQLLVDTTQVCCCCYCSYTYYTAAADAHTGLPVVTKACSTAAAVLKEHSVSAVDYVYLLLLIDTVMP
jgi:hypothetical protein